MKTSKADTHSVHKERMAKARDGGAQLVQCLPSMYKALDSIPSIA